MRQRLPLALLAAALLCALDTQAHAQTNDTAADDLDHNGDIDVPRPSIDVRRGKIDVRGAEIRVLRRTSM